MLSMWDTGKRVCFYYHEQAAENMIMNDRAIGEYACVCVEVLWEWLMLEHNEQSSWVKVWVIIRNLTRMCEKNSSMQENLDDHNYLDNYLAH